MQKEDLDNMGMNLNEHTPDRAPSIEGRKEGKHRHCMLLKKVKIL